MSFPADGPFFDDLKQGQVLPALPSVTISAADNALYRAITGDQYALASDSTVANQVTGGEGSGLVNPSLLINYSIGQSTMATRRAIANLYYRDMLVLRPVALGARVATRTTVMALKPASPKPGVAARGKVLLGIETRADGEPVMEYQRCALLPSRGDVDQPDAGEIPAMAPSALAEFGKVAPHGWNLMALGKTDWAVGEKRRDITRDHIDMAAAFARMTFNQAIVHRDPDESVHGRRLVYGGHVVGLAQASLSRLFPEIATVLGWAACSHTAPAFEGDVLAFEHELTEQLETPQGRLSMFSVKGYKMVDGAEQMVLDWTPVMFHA